MNTRWPRGFIWDGKFFPNKGSGHEGNARDIIYEYEKLHPNEDWDWGSYGTASDFLIMKKKAIQVASGSDSSCAIASGKVYTKEEVNRKLERFGLSGYKIYLFWNG